MSIINTPIFKQTSIVASVSLFLTLGICSPANAVEAEHSYLESTPEVFAAVQVPQSLTAGNSEEIEAQYQEELFQLSSAEEMTPKHNYDVEATISLALSEVGSSRPTGWSQPGECIMSVNRWLNAGGAELAGLDPVNNYKDFTEVPWSEAAAGDVVQYEYINDPTAWATGVHTLLIIGKNDDGTFQIVESNNPGGSGYVSKQDSWSPTPPSGFRAVVWRY